MAGGGPTRETFQYILDNHPERFEYPMDARRTLDTWPTAEEGWSPEDLAEMEQENLEDLGNYYDSDTYGSLEEREVPLEADPDGDGVFDPTFAAICTTCNPGEPCCMTGGSITDAEVSSRKLEWPPQNGQTKMLMVAKEMENSKLVAKLKLAWEGRTCQVGNANRPSIGTRGIAQGNGRLTIPDKAKDVAVGETPPVFGAIALAKFIPSEAIAALMIFDLFMAMRNPNDGFPTATFSPNQCVSDGPMAAGLRVVAVPFIKLEGTLELATRISFTTGGVSGGASAKGSLVGEYGNLKFEAKGDASATENSGSVKDNGSRSEKGVVGLMSQIIGKMDKYVSEGNTSRTAKKLDLTQFTSGVTLTKSLKFEAGAFELKGKAGSPDLEVDIGGLTSTLAIGVTGRLDFIDILARVYTGPGGDIIARTRAAMKNGERIRATLDAYLEMGAHGNIAHTVDSGASITIPANGDAAVSFDGVSNQLTGEFKINGLAKLGIHIEAEVWVFKAEAGASGSVHTSWLWEMKTTSAGRQKRYTFEGVQASLEAYARSSVTSSSSGVTQNVFAANAEYRASANVGDLFQQVTGGMTAAEAESVRLAGITPTRPGGQLFNLMQPEQGQWEDY